MEWMRIFWVLALVIVAGLGASACGGGTDLNLTPAAAEGREIANSSGCASCHGKEGQGITAPSWQGIYQEPIELDDGTTVIGDDDYLRRSITDPQAQIVDTWTIKMPANSLDDAQIDAVIAYIKELQ